MHTLNIKKSLNWEPTVSERAVRLMRLFGLRMTRLKGQRLCHECNLNLDKGQICFITGSSGAGKSVLLNAMYEQARPTDRIRLDDIELEQKGAMIDYIDPDASGLWNALKILSKAGLSDVFSMLNRPATLSAGQQWRYRLAKALISDRHWIFADEFTASLDRITACVIAHNLRKLASQSDKIFVLASCHEDILADLQPDVIVIKYLNGTTRTIYKDRSKNTGQ